MWRSCRRERVVRKVRVLLFIRKGQAHAHDLTCLDSSGVGQTGPSKFVPFPYRTFDEKDLASDAHHQIGEGDGNGLEMPMGPPAPQPLPGKARHSSLLYNEYIVYDVNQVVVRYLIKVKFNFGRRG